MRKILVFLLLFLLSFSSVNVRAEEKTFPLDKGYEGFYFSLPTCHSCQEIEEFIRPFFDVLSIKEYNFHQIDYDKFKDYFNLPDKYSIKLPAIYYDGELYLGVEGCNNFQSKYMYLFEDTSNKINKGSVKSLDTVQIVNTQPVGGAAITINNLSKIKSNFTDFNQYKPLGYGLLGFIDGFNPCAIAMLMVFMLFLAQTSGFKRSKIVLGGLLFIIGSFLGNFIIGLFFYKLDELAQTFSILYTAISIFSIVICLIAIVLNLIDIVNGFRHKEDIVNKLSDSNKEKIMSVSKKFLSSKFWLFILPIAGFLISLMEFGCTGQLYIPAIKAFLSGEGIPGLIIYNLFFIVPLIIFFILSFFFDSNFIKKKIMEKSYVIKIFTTILFVALIVILIVNF